MVDSQEFHRLLASSNPLRMQWSDGDQYFEKRGLHDMVIGFRTLGGICYVTPHIFESYFKRPPSCLYPKTYAHAEALLDSFGRLGDRRVVDVKIDERQPLWARIELNDGNCQDVTGGWAADLIRLIREESGLKPAPTC